jgi:tetratricopeptide (TPR) repeat protein
MDHRSEPDRTVGEAACDPLEAGLAAAFGPDSGPPLPVTGSVVQALGAAPVQLRQPDTEPADPVVRPHSDAVSAEAPARLLLHGEIARGGMGAVLKGRDVDLGRDVAVKVLLETHQGRTELVQRFVEEAQIAGQLQHPGVVPVYAMGQLPDKRPYFTMKLVKGQTLARLLAQRKDLSQDRPRLLKVFEQVCQALAYAHARGVIHRDLKPSNVMVGAFGEVQVMDWGLAKILRQGGADEKAPTPAEATVIRTARGGPATPPPPGSQTQAGAVLGTPAYMAPEQARGEVAQLDERCDVFGLGALLCHILTGQPPYAGADAEAVCGLASRADLAGAFARLDGCDADAELIGLAKRCLCADKAGRPRDAGALAAELTAYLEGVEARLRQAELERAAAQARAAEERKRRRVALALAAAVLALVAVGAGGGLWVQRQAAQRREDQARREAEQRQQVEAALDKAAALRQQARWREAEAVLGQARQALGEAGTDDLRRRLEVALAELALVNRLDTIRQHRATWIAGGFDKPTAEHDYAAVFREAGLGEVGEDEAAVAGRVRASGVSGPLVAALDDWASIAAEPTSKAWLLKVARLAAPDPWGDRFRDPAVWQDRQKLQALADEALRDGGARLGELSPQVLESLGLLLGEGPEAVPLLRAAQRRYADDFWLNFRLGNALRDANQVEEAVGYHRAAVALRPDNVAAHHNLGNALYAKQDLDGAIAEYRQAIALDPKFAYAHITLGAILNDDFKDHAAAIAEFRKAIALDPKLAMAHANLGVALYGKKDLDGAIAEYRQAITLAPNLALAHDNLGGALRAKGDLDGAITAYRKAIALDPKDAGAHIHLGDALDAKGDVDGAIAAYRRAIELDPKDAKAHVNLGGLLHDHLKDPVAGIAEFHKAIALDPRNAMAHTNLGIALYGRKDLDGAIAEYRQAITLDPNLALAHHSLGNALRAKGDLDGAIAECRRAIALDPKDAHTRSNLGLALYDKQDVDGAIAECRRAIALDPKCAPAHVNLGSALSAKGDVRGAIAEFRKAIDLAPQAALAHYNLGGALRDKGDVDGAIAAYRKAIEIDPDYAQAHCNLGHALREQGRFAEALEEMRRGHALGSQRPGWRHPSAAWVRQCERMAELDGRRHALLRGETAGVTAADLMAYALDRQRRGQLDEAVTLLRQTVALQPELADAHGNLGWLLEKQGRLDESTAESRAAIRLAPNVGWYHNNLGWSLQRLGRLEEAAEEYRLALRHDPAYEKARVNLRNLEPLLPLLPRLEAVRRGEPEPTDAAQVLRLAQLCHLKRLNRAAAGLYADAFAADRKLANDLGQAHRYNAACCAALAAAGQGDDAQRLPDKVVVMLRGQALQWLRADLVLRARMADRDDPAAKQEVREKLGYWQQDADLAPVRDPQALDNLPNDERQAWQQLWADVGVLRQRVESTK